MTRKEEREQASNLVFKIRLCPRTAFIRGAEWADRNPRKGLVDIEKACKWLDENAYLHIVDGDSVTSLLEYFRKAMEE